MLNTIRDRWQSASPGARLGLAAGIATLLVAMSLASYWLLHEDYQVLFSDLASQDAAAVVSELDRLKIPYRLADGGATVLVDRDAVHKTRLTLMSKGVDLHGGVGLEIFNNSDLGMTEFVQKVNYQRALQGELARTIGALDEVKAVRVHLVLPEYGLFKSPNAKPKASVSLAVKDNAGLAPEQIAGIQRLVAASVPEITPPEVTIVDQHGVALSGGGSDTDVDGSSSGRLDTKKRIEDYLARKIVGVMDRAIGPGKAIVSVDAVIDYNRVNVTKEDIVPLPNTMGQNVGAITRRRESSQGGDPFPGESAGTPGAQGGRTIVAQTASSSTLETEYAIGRRVENIVSTPGNIQRLSVGVLVPGISDPVELEKLKEFVTLAVGVDTKRGDAIAVYSVAPPSAKVADVTTPLAQPSSAQDTAVRHPGFQFPVWTWPAILALLITAAAAAFTAGRRSTGNRHVVPERLGMTEREALLKEIAQWASLHKS